MDRETFEKLLSDWLADPTRDDLRARLDAVAARHPDLARLREQHLRLERLLRSTATNLPPIAWQRVKALVNAAIDRTAPAGDDARLDEHLRALPDIDAHVDWAAFRAKVSLQIDRRTAGPRVLRLRPRRWLAAVGFLSAAAALALMLSFPPIRPPASSQAPETGAPATHAYVRVHCPPGAGMDCVCGGGSACAVVIHDPELEIEEPAPPDGSTPEVFFMLEPPDVALTMASPTWQGSR